jgi:ankyrin repeat protein
MKIHFHRPFHSIGIALALIALKLSADPVTEALQRGLIAEEVSHNLTEAVAAFEEAVRLSAEQRTVQAAALYHLADCQWQLGQTNQAVRNFQRLVREYPDQKRFAELAERAGHGSTNPTSPNSASPSDAGQTPSEARRLESRLAELSQQLDIVRDEIAIRSQLLEIVDSDPSIAGLRLLQSRVHNPVVDKLMAQGAENALTRAKLMATVGPGHPDLKAVDITSDVIEKQLQNERESAMRTVDLQRKEFEFRRLRLEAQIDDVRKRLEVLKEEDAATKQKPKATPNAVATSPAHSQDQPVDKEATVLSDLQRIAIESPDQLTSGRLSKLISDGMTNAVRFLLEHGVSPNSAERDDDLPLVTATRNGNLAMVRLLVEKGAEPNRFRQLGALHTAAKAGSLAIAEYLLEHGADANLVAGNAAPGWVAYATPLHFADLNNRTRVLQTLLDHGAKVNATSQTGCTPLLLAISEKHGEAVNALLAAGANPNLGGQCFFDQVQSGSDQRRLWWKTPLGLAAAQNDVPLILALLKAGALSNFSSMSGRTALHEAAIAGAEQAAKALIQAGADPNFQDIDGGSPLDIAQSNLRALLLQSGAINIRTNINSRTSSIIGGGATPGKFVFLFGAVTTRTLLADERVHHVNEFKGTAGTDTEADFEQARLVQQDFNNWKMLVSPVQSFAPEPQTGSVAYIEIPARGQASGH